MRGNNFFSKWGNKIRFPVGNSEGDFLKLNIAQKQITWFVQNNKDKNSFLIRVRFCLLPVVTSEGLNLRLVVLHKNQELVLYKSTKCWVLPVKTYLTAPYLVKGVSKKLNFGFTFALSRSLVYGGQNQKPPERRWCPPKQTYNWIAAKRRINRHDLYGASAAGRLTAQRRAGLPVRKVRFGSADTQHTVWCHAFKARKPLYMRPLSDEKHEGE